MGEMREMLLDTARRLFEETCTPDLLRAADAGAFSQPLWSALADVGFTRANVSVDGGGAGLDLADALALMVEAGRYALPAPLGEAMLASWLLEKAGLPVPETILTVAPVHPGDAIEAVRDGDKLLVSGTARRVPWARVAGAIVVLAATATGPVVAVVPREAVRLGESENVAGEPRDDVDFARAEASSFAPADVSAADVQALGAVIRSAQIAGALQRVLDTCVVYVQERVQFGRPIGKFQAIQHNLAVLAGQTAAATAAAEAAIEAAGNGDLASIAIGAAKLRAGEAAGAGAALAHQAHGAIGFTRDYSLHLSTRRLWSWRDEFGNEAYWGRKLGETVAAAGADQLWATLTAA